MDRRGFLGFLASLPLVGRLVPAPERCGCTAMQACKFCAGANDRRAAETWTTTGSTGHIDLPEEGGPVTGMVVFDGCLFVQQEKMLLRIDAKKRIQVLAMGNRLHVNAPPTRVIGG